MIGRWTRIARSARALSAHTLLLFFTLLLALKLDHRVSFSWWTIFVPVWLFHAVTAGGRFSLPAPSLPYDRHWAPCHAVIAAPLLIAFELLLCTYLESLWVYGEPAVKLIMVFLPLIILEIIIFIDNLRICWSFFPEQNEESLSEDATLEAFLYMWVAISMVFFLAATTFTLLKLCGDIDGLGWWNALLILGIAECFAFLACTKWINPMIHERPLCLERGSAPRTSITPAYADRNSDFVISEEVESQVQLCGLQEVGGHIMKIPIIAFQVLICMHLEGTPPSARNIPVLLVFLPLFILQGVGVLLSTLRLIEKLVFIVRSGSLTRSYLTITSRASDCFAFLRHGSRFLGWWSTDKGSKEQQARMFHAGGAGYNTFSACPPQVVKKMPKKDLVEEIWRLQAALGEQAEITKYNQQEYERLRNEKIICSVCFEGEICMVLFPCKHRTLCKPCSQKCKRCPICRVVIVERMPVFDA